MAAPQLLFFSSKSCKLCAKLSDDVRKVTEVGVTEITADDHAKWAPELIHYKVKQVPAFVLLDGAGRAVASTTLPRPYEDMQRILGALVARAQQ